MIERLRKGGNKTPVIVLTGHDQDGYLRRALSLKLEAYLLKPLTSGRLFAVMNQLCASVVEEFCLSRERGMHYVFGRKQVRLQGAWISLTHMEIALLELLIREAGKIVTPAQIEMALYPDREMSPGALRSLVQKLRAKLPGLPLQTHSREGYLLEMQEVDHAGV